ncbi:SDR family oxidoreductase, partial [Candidatus Gottesmanbacteria bacterium]|nr:SDR family oxidoreductase [Candidatus Gottesmanbacteria bacterium]
MKNPKRYAIVTGASTGIGRAIAVALGGAGIMVGLVARSKNRLEETLTAISKSGGKGNVFPLDLLEIPEIYSFAEIIRKEWGEIHILANVAGIYHDTQKAYYNIPFEKYSKEEILNTYGVGTNGTTFLTHALLPLMKKGSHIINLSGTFENGNSGWLPYYVSKRAIEDFTVGLAQELKFRGIHVNCISPSDTATETYKKFFPEYYDEAMDPKKIGEFIAEFCAKKDPTTGKVFVLKKDIAPYEGFHN